MRPTFVHRSVEQHAALILVAAVWCAPLLAANRTPDVAPAPPSAPWQVLDAEAAHDRAAALAAAGKFDEAQAIFEAAARQHALDGTLAAAVAILQDRRAGRVPDAAVQRIFQAFDRANADAWKAAFDHIDHALTLAPGYARVHAARGSLLLMQDRAADAIAPFDRALALDPKLAEAFFNRGVAYSLLEQHDRAIADFTRATELQVNFVAAYTHRGTAYLNRALSRGNAHDITLASADYGKAHQLAPRDPEPLFQRGVLNALTEQWPAAEADFTQVVALDERYPDAYYNRGLAVQQQGADARALADYTKAVDVNPADPKPLINRGLLYAKQKKYEAAIADYDRALALGAGFVNTYYNKGQALEAMGRPADAMAQYAIVVSKGTPASALVQQARQRLAALQRVR